MTLPPSLFELLKLELFPLFLISASAFPPEPPYAVGFAVKLLLVVFATAPFSTTLLPPEPPSAFCSCSFSFLIPPSTPVTLIRSPTGFGNDIPKTALPPTCCLQTIFVPASLCRTRELLYIDNLSILIDVH